MFRVGVIRQSGKIESKNCSTLEECYDFILKEEYRHYRILNKETSQIIEKE